MQQLNFPKYPIKQKHEDGVTMLWDIVRRKWVVQQPEEIVRQHLIWYLIEELNYPRSLMSVEKQIIVNKQRKRYDLVMHTTSLQTVLIAECKAPDIKINQAVFNQIGQYNIALKVPFLIVTNGIKHFFCEVNHNEKSFIFQSKILTWEQITDKYA